MQISSYHQVLAPTFLVMVYLGSKHCITSVCPFVGYLYFCVLLVRCAVGVSEGDGTFSLGGKLPPPESQGTPLSHISFTAYTGYLYITIVKLEVDRWFAIKKRLKEL